MSVLLNSLAQVLVTGAAQGIGKLMAIELANEGCVLSLCDIAAHALDETG